MKGWTGWTEVGTEGDCLCGPAFDLMGDALCFEWVAIEWDASVY